MDNKMNDKTNDTFQYTYSAKQQAEIKAIRKKYMEPEEDKMEQLRRLDAGVAQKAMVRSLSVGIIGALILGIGMSLTMSDFAEILGMYQEMALVIGSIIGIVGLVLVCIAYPVYTRTMKKERELAAPEIMRLTDELLK